MNTEVIQRRVRVRTATVLTPIGKAGVAVSAGWVAGFVDVTGFLLLSHVLTANMSGNTVHVAIGTATLAWADVVRGGLALSMYVAGLIVSAVVHEAGLRHGLVSTSAVVLGAETVLLIGFEVLHAGIWQLGSTVQRPYFEVTLLALAMGLQNATITRVGALSVKTTHITGTLTEFAAGLSQFLFWFHDRLQARYPGRRHRVWRTALHQKPLRQAVLLGALWIAFFAGAIAGALATGSWGALALAPPIGVLIVLTVLDIVRPIAASDEHAWVAKHKKSILEGSRVI
jgi:uncharacterized membrane protein YoaK (UPF0700 family)